MAKRLEPLQAAQRQHEGLSAAAAEAEAEMAELAHDVVLGGAAALPAVSDPHAEAKRLQRLADGVRQLRTGGTLRLNERILMVLGGILAPLGLVLILVGWNGAAHTPNLFEQIPYAISGGLFGLGLLFLGSFCYFAHWTTELVKEHRAQSAAIVEAIGRLEDVLRQQGPPVGAGPSTATAALNGVALVATEKGTMAHRPDCVVVAGKAGLRGVAADEQLAPCKLCDPYAT
jgi:multisubunit Na+/H+ antiporter MnhG subunit